MAPGTASARGVVERVLRSGLERLHGPGSVLITEYPRRPRARWGWHGEGILEEVEARLAPQVRTYAAEIAAMRQLLDWADTIPRHPAPGQPCWENDWWGTIDALMQCAALKRRNPRTYLEIGAGFSTLFAARAISDFRLQTRIVSVDREPRADIAARCDELVRQPLEEVAPEVLARLGPGDIVLFDGSHMALMNSDATVFFLEILPRLPPGVLVGIDDVFLPWDYPDSWTDRPYAEQYLLAAFLLGGGDGYEVRFPAWWVVETSTLGKELSDLWPVVENRFGRHATSFWMERAAV